MDYEQKYKEALEKAKDFYTICKKCGAKDTVDFLENTFSELKESNDERIRKVLIDIFNVGAQNGGKTNGVCDKDILAWLEKQGKGGDE